MESNITLDSLATKYDTDNDPQNTSHLENWIDYIYFYKSLIVLSKKDSPFK